MERIARIVVPLGSYAKPETLADRASLSP